jgi:hypothetical protein
MVVVAMSAVVMLGTAGPVGSQAPAERQTVTLFDPRGSQYEKDIDTGRKGFSPGDEFIFIENQLDPETCEKVGKLVGHGQVVKFIGDNDGLITIDVTVDLDAGKIMAYGAAKFSEFDAAEPPFAVIGGTELYRDASGEVSFEEGVTLCDKKGSLTIIDVGPVR